MSDFTISHEPIEINDNVNYETRRVKCARCGAVMPYAPWPTNSNDYRHRPRCGACDCAFTFPAAETK